MNLARPGRSTFHPLREATEWLAKYQAYWDESYQRLDELLARLKANPPKADDGRNN